MDDGMKAEIRAATIQDVPLLLGFIRELAEFEKLSHLVTATEEALRASLFPGHGRPAAECVLAFAEGRPAGYALWFTTFSTFLAKPGLWLEDLYVTPALRHQGIGRALIFHVAKLANQRGCGRMEWSVLDWNAPAITFYDSLGAKSLPDWRICRLTGEDLSRYR
jgi:GNAT superfamily N-acetyltransferase